MATASGASSGPAIADSAILRVRGQEEQEAGQENMKQPDWFTESSVVLSELIEKSNALFSKWLSSGINCDRQRYAVQHRLVASAVKRAKNDWLLKKARSVHGSWDVVKWFYRLCLEEFEGYSERKSRVEASSVQTY